MPTLQEVLSQWLTDNGITLNLLQAGTLDEFLDLMNAADTHLGIVNDDLVQRVYDNDGAKNLGDNLGTVVDAGMHAATYRDTTIALGLPSQGASMVLAPAAELAGDVLSFSTAVTSHFAGLVFALAIDAPNSFDFEVKLKGGQGADGTDTTIQGCATQQLYLVFSGVNYVVNHVMWNKKPPAGTNSVERSAMDNEGDSPKGKVPSTAEFKPETNTANWNVPFCSEGDYEVTVTVQWTCIATDVKSKKEKTITITVTGP